MYNEMKKSVLMGMMCVMALTASAQTYKNGAWYSLYDDEKHTMNTQGDYETGNVFAPTAGKLNVNWGYEWIDWVGAFKKVNTQVLESADGGSTTNLLGKLKENTSNNSNTTESFTTGRNINWIKFNRPNDEGLGGPTHKVHVYHLDIPLAKHILLSSGTYGTTELSHDFGEQEQQTASEAFHVDLRSFLSAGDITVTSSMPTVFRVGTSDNTTGLTYAVGANACASANGKAAAAGGGTLGKIANYGFDIYFTPDRGGLCEAVITLTDGVSTASVTVSGTGRKLNQTISWETEGEILTTGSIATATASSGLEVAYSFAPEGIVTYEQGAFTILSEGVVAITASQAGDDRYNAAEPVTKTITIYPASARYSYERAICEGDTYSDENFDQLTEAGFYYDTVPMAHGGDSVICLTLTLNPTYLFEENLSIKVGDEAVWQNINLAEMPVGDTTLVAAYLAQTGCDSAYVLYLHVQPRITTYGYDTVSFCAGEKYVYEGKTYRRETVDSVLLSEPNQFGGDSIVVLVVKVYPVLTVTASSSITEGDADTWQDIDLSTLPVGDTTLVASYVSIHGCDSTFILNLTVTEKKLEGIMSTFSADKSVQKIVRNGQVFIRKGEEWFDIYGRKVQ